MTSSQRAPVPEKGTLHGPRFEIDASLRIVAWPEETARRTRISAEEALGKPCWQLVHPGSSARPPGCLRSCLAIPGSAQLAPTDLARRLEDEPCAAMPLPAPRGGAMVWMAERESPTPEVTDPMEGVLVRGCMSESLGDVRQTLEFLRRYTAADDCELFLIDDRQQEVHHTGCTGLDTQALLELTRIPLGQGYPGGVTARQRPMLTNDFQNDRVFLRSSLRRCGIRSFLGVPLSRDGQPLGYLGLGWRDVRVPITPLISRLEGLKPLLVAGLPRTRPVIDVQQVPGLSIRALGALELRVDGERVPPHAFARRKALTLLQLLLLRAPAAVHREVLIDHLWPEADARSGGNRLHGVVHALRTVLGRGDPHAGQFIEHQHAAYAFRPSEAAFVDLFEFRRLLQKARNPGGRLADDEVTSALARAVALYEGDLFADDPYSEWLDAPRQRLRDEYLHAVRELTTRYARAKRHEDALPVLRQALQIDPLAEDLHQRLTRALHALGRSTEAGEYYQRLRALLPEE